MKKQILTLMSSIVENTMTSYKSDFYNHDLKSLENYSGAFIWQIANSHTHLTKCDVTAIVSEMRTNESSLFAYAQHQSWGEAVISYKWMGEKLFYYGGDEDDKGLVEVPRDWALGCYHACVYMALETIEAEGIKLPTNFKVNVRFGDTTTRKEFVKCVRYAREHNDDSLLECAKRFHSWRKVARNHEVVIHKDAYNDKCFSFVEKYNGEYGVIGGIVFHGYDEYTTNGSVQLTPTKGWATHT